MSIYTIIRKLQVCRFREDTSYIIVAGEYELGRQLQTVIAASTERTEVGETTHI